MTQQCRINFGDDSTGSDSNFTNVGSIFDENVIHRYDAIGFYDVRFECWNDYGQLDFRQTIMAADPVTGYEYRSIDLDIQVPVVGSSTYVDDVEVLINYQSVPVVVSSDNVTISRDLFLSSGENVVQIIGNNKVIFTKIFNLQEPIDDVTISTDQEHVTADTLINFDYNIAQGDSLQIEIDYGNGTLEYLQSTSPESPLVIRRQHAYSELGIYDVSLLVANDISWLKATQLVSIERPIQHAVLWAENSTQIGAPTTFKLDVDLDLTPAMPVKVRLKLGGKLTLREFEKKPVGSLSNVPKNAVLTLKSHYPE